MIEKNVFMKFWWGVVVVVVVVGAGCTKPNPRSCADGSCTDPAFPFCDFDGSVQGEAGTCIAVSCTPMEFDSCRGDQEIVCNATGDNFDVVKCPLGCSEAVGGCQPCASNDQCTDETPVCDQGTCRTCTADAECDSLVCDRSAGTCVSEAALLYVSPVGVDDGECTKAQPCNLPRAVTLASAAAVAPTIRLLPEIFQAQLTIDSPVTLKLIATGADLRTKLVVRTGAIVEVRNLDVASQIGSVACGDPTFTSTTDPQSILTLRESHLSSVAAYRCNLNVFDSEIEFPVSNVTRVDLREDSTFVGDRLLMKNTSVTGNPPSGIVSVGGPGGPVGIRLTNSVMLDVIFVLTTSRT
jgi:hypothetical protein